MIAITAMVTVNRLSLKCIPSLFSVTIPLTLQRMFFQNFSSTLSLSLLLALGGMTAVQADYAPPQEEVPDGTTIANGSRTSCRLEAGETVFTPLAPITHLGKSDQPPEIFFYVPVLSDYRLDVGIFQDGDFVAFTEKIASGAGVISVMVPEPLDHGQYQLQAAIACGSDTEYVAEAITYFTLENLSEELTLSLADATPTEQADIYAAAGYWYDAFSLANEHQKLKFLGQLAAAETEAQQANIEAIAKILMPITTE